MGRPRRARNHLRGYFDAAFVEASSGLRRTPPGTPSSVLLPLPSPSQRAQSLPPMGGSNSSGGPPSEPRRGSLDIPIIAGDDGERSEDSTPSATTASSASSSPSPSPTDDLVSAIGDDVW